MSVYCVNSGNTHATLYAAENAEHGQHVGLVIFLVTGFDTSDPVFSGSGYDEVEIRPAGGYEWDGIEANLTAGVGSLNYSADSMKVMNLGVKYVNAANGPLITAENCLLGHTNTGGTVFSPSNVTTSIINNCIIKGTVKTPSLYNPNFEINNSSIVSASGYGVIRGKTTNSAILNTGSATVVQGVETNTYSDDGAGSTINNLSESDFVDYASGDYRLKADSPAALAGAGAFIEEVVTAGDHDSTIADNFGGYSASVSASSSAPGFSASAADLFGGYISTLTTTSTKPSFDTSITNVFGGYLSSVHVANTQPGFDSLIADSFGGYSSLVVGSFDAGDNDASISDQFGGYAASISATNDKPQFPAIVTSGFGGYTADVVTYNGLLNFVTPPENIIELPYQSTIVNLNYAGNIIDV